MKYDEYQQAFIDEDMKNYDVLVLKAVSGAGKSTSIVGKIMRHINKNDFNKDEVVVTTFSNKSASDIRKKLFKNGILVKNIGTTHKIMINFYKEYVGDLKIIPEWDTVKIMRQFVGEIRQFGTKKELNSFTSKVMNMVQYYNANMFDCPIDEFNINEFYDNSQILEQEFIDIYKLYDNYKREQNLFDFDDLLSKRLYSQLPIEKIAKSIKHIYIDESQDYNKANYNLIKVMFPYSKVILVGDVGQKIYAFRWSYSVPMTDESYWGDKKVKYMKIVNNYRSTGTIVKVYNEYRKHFDKLDAIPHNPDVKGSVNFVTVDNEYDVGKFIANDIKERGYDYKDVTILVRKASFIKTSLEPAFVNSGIPYTVATPQYKRKFYEVQINKFFLNIVNYLLGEKDVRSIHEISDCLIGIGVSFKDRLLSNPNINDVKMNKINDMVDEINDFDKTDIKSILLSINTLVMKYVKHSLYTDKQINSINKTIYNFFSMLMEQEGITSYDDIVYEMFQRIHEHEDTKDAVTFTSVHQYKGLENKIVYVTNTSDVQFNIDESTYPVMYVALSRAIDRAVIVENSYMTTYNMGKMKTKPYPFWDRTKKNVIEQLTRRK